MRGTWFHRVFIHVSTRERTFSMYSGVWEVCIGQLPCRLDFCQLDNIFRFLVIISSSHRLRRTQRQPLVSTNLRLTSVHSQLVASVSNLARVRHWCVLCTSTAMYPTMPKRARSKSWKSEWGDVTASFPRIFSVKNKQGTAQYGNQEILFRKLRHMELKRNEI